MEALRVARSALQSQLDALDVVVLSAAPDEASLILVVQCHLQRAVDLLSDSHALQPQSAVAVDNDVKGFLDLQQGIVRQA